MCSDNTETTHPTILPPNALLNHCEHPPPTQPAAKARASQSKKKYKNKRRKNNRPDKNKVMKTGYLSWRQKRQRTMDLLQEGPPIGFKRCFKRIHWLSKTGILFVTFWKKAGRRNKVLLEEQGARLNSGGCWHTGSQYWFLKLLVRSKGPKGGRQAQNH